MYYHLNITFAHVDLAMYMRWISKCLTADQNRAHVDSVLDSKRIRRFSKCLSPWMKPWQFIIRQNNSYSTSTKAKKFGVKKWPEKVMLQLFWVVSSGKYYSLRKIVLVKMECAYTQVANYDKQN